MTMTPSGGTDDVVIPTAVMEQRALANRSLRRRVRCFIKEFASEVVELQFLEENFDSPFSFTDLAAHQKKASADLIRALRFHSPDLKDPDMLVKALYKDRVFPPSIPLPLPPPSNLITIRGWAIPYSCSPNVETTTITIGSDSPSRDEEPMDAIEEEVPESVPAVAEEVCVITSIPTPVSSPVKEIITVSSASPSPVRVPPLPSSFSVGREPVREPSQVESLLEETHPVIVIEDSPPKKSPTGPKAPKKYSEKMKAEASIVQRVNELQKEGMWYDKRLPKVAEAPRIKAQWDYLLEEMHWMASDFALERKYKKTNARKISRMIEKHFLEKKYAADRAKRDLQLNIRRKAYFIAREVVHFWNNVKTVVEYKQQCKIDQLKKKTMDDHLSYIVDQTEKYSTMLAESFVAGVGGGSEHGSKSNTKSVPSLPTPTMSDVDFDPEDKDEEDDEETIAKADEEGGSGDDDELQHLSQQAELSLDDFLDQLPAGYLDDRLKAESEGQASCTDAVATSPSDEKMDVDEVEDTPCTSTQTFEKNVSDIMTEDDSPEPPPAVPDASEPKTEDGESLISDSCNEIDETTDYESARTENHTTDIDALITDVEPEEDPDETEGEEEETAQEKETSVGLATLLQSFAPEKADDAPDEDAVFNSVTALAESFQPTGYTLSSANVVTEVPHLLKHSLREYQHIGLDWLVTMNEKKLNGILADEMGLGKTIQTIALLAHMAVEKCIWGPHLIIVPTSVMLNWEMEFKKWCPGFKILTYYGSQRTRKLKRTGWTKPNSFHVCITSYKLVCQDHQSFRRKRWKYLILDEAQNIKNFQSQRWQLLLNFQAHRRLLLTGTPLQNNLMELWSLMHFLMPNVFQSHSEFREWFSKPVTGMVEGSSDYNDGIIRRLHKVLRPFILRRLKSEVEKQLPQKYEHIVLCRLSKRQRFLYEEFMSRTKTKETLSAGNLLSVINVLMQLRKVCNHPNLFEPRPIISPLRIEPIFYPVPSVVWDIRNEMNFNKPTSSIFHLSEADFTLSQLEARIIRDGRKGRLSRHAYSNIQYPYGVDRHVSVFGHSNRSDTGDVFKRPAPVDEPRGIKRTGSVLFELEAKRSLGSGNTMKNDVFPLKPQPEITATLANNIHLVRQLSSLPNVSPGENKIITLPVLLKEQLNSPTKTNHLQTRLIGLDSSTFAPPPPPVQVSDNRHDGVYETEEEIGLSLMERMQRRGYRSVHRQLEKQKKIKLSNSLRKKHKIDNSLPYEFGTREVTYPNCNRNPQVFLANKEPNVLQDPEFVYALKMASVQQAKDIKKPSNGNKRPCPVSEDKGAPPAKKANIIYYDDDWMDKDDEDESFGKGAKRLRKSRGSNRKNGIWWMKTFAYKFDEFHHIGNVEARKIKDRRVVFERLKRQNARKCLLFPVIGRDCIDACKVLGQETLPVMRYFGNRTMYMNVEPIRPLPPRNYNRNGYYKFGQGEIALARTAKLKLEPTHPLLKWRITHCLKSLLWSISDIVERTQDICRRFLIYVPPTAASPIQESVIKPCVSFEQKRASLYRKIQRSLTNTDDIIHPIVNAMRTQFPDPRLIQYDCGKLQVLDKLLHRLKSEDHRALIFTQMTKMLDVLEAFLNYHGYIYLRLDGATKIEQRQLLMERFNTDRRIFCFILSTRSGGIGVNLTGADTVIFYDSDWNPTMDAQAQDRCHRIGQTRDVHIYRLVSEKTVEENILKKSNQKRMLGELAIEGGNFTTAYFKQNTIHELFEVNDMENDATKRMAELLDGEPALLDGEPALLDGEPALLKIDESLDRSFVSTDSEKVGEDAVIRNVALSASSAFESALSAAEDERDVQAAQNVRDETAADLAEFDDHIPLEEPDTRDPNSLEMELVALTMELLPVERYAVQYVESSIDDWQIETVDTVRSQIELQQQQWELKQQDINEDKARGELSDEDDFLTFSGKDSRNQVKKGGTLFLKKVGRPRKHFSPPKLYSVGGEMSGIRHTTIRSGRPGRPRKMKYLSPLRNFSNTKQSDESPSKRSESNYQPQCRRGPGRPPGRKKGFGNNRITTKKPLMVSEMISRGRVGRPPRSGRGLVGRNVTLSSPSYSKRGRRRGQYDGESDNDDWTHSSDDERNVAGKPLVNGSLHSEELEAGLQVPKSLPETPVKRKRGRPPRPKPILPESEVTDHYSATEGILDLSSEDVVPVKIKVEVDTEVPLKRKRGRPPRNANLTGIVPSNAGAGDVTRIDLGNEREELVLPSQEPVIKRKRGRPPVKQHVKSNSPLRTESDLTDISVKDIKVEKEEREDFLSTHFQDNLDYSKLRQRSVRRQRLFKVDPDDPDTALYAELTDGSEELEFSSITGSEASSLDFSSVMSYSIKEEELSPTRRSRSTSSYGLRKSIKRQAKYSPSPIRKPRGMRKSASRAANSSANSSANSFASSFANSSTNSSANSSVLDATLASEVVSCFSSPVETDKSKSIIGDKKQRKHFKNRSKSALQNGMASNLLTTIPVKRGPGRPRKIKIKEEPP